MLVRRRAVLRMCNCGTVCPSLCAEPDDYTHLAHVGSEDHLRALILPKSKALILGSGSRVQKEERAQNLETPGMLEILVEH